MEELNNPNSSEPVIQTPINTHFIDLSQHQKNIFKILFLIFLVLFLIVASVLTTLLITKNKTPDSSQITPVPTPTVVDESADWQTYTDSTYKYSIKYPIGWTTKNSETKVTQISTIEDFKNMEEKPIFGPKLTIKTYNSLSEASNNLPNIKTLKDLVANDVKGSINNKITALTINGISGFSYNTDYPDTRIYLQKGNLIYSIHTGSMNDNGIEQQIINTFKFEDSATTSTIPKDWKTYNSTDLGLFFKYSPLWGEPQIRKEDNNTTAENPPLNGKSFIIEFDGFGSVVGYTKNYYNYIASNYYVGGQSNLDGVEMFSNKDGEIYFTKKAVTANQKTLTKTSLKYLPEASGVLITSETNLNGKNEYTGIQILKYYPSLNKKINQYYNEVGDNKKLETETIKSLTELKEGISIDKETLNNYNEYQKWLTTFKFN